MCGKIIDNNLRYLIGINVFFCKYKFTIIIILYNCIILLSFMCLRYGYHIFVLTNKLIDYSKVSSSNYAQRISCKLDSIQKMLNIQGKSYKLRGATELKRGRYFFKCSMF